MTSHFFAWLQFQGPWGVINRLKAQTKEEGLFLFSFSCCGKTSRLVDCAFHIIPALRTKWVLRHAETEARPGGLFSTHVTWVRSLCLESLLGISVKREKKCLVSGISRAESQGQTAGGLQCWHNQAEVKRPLRNQEIPAAINLTCRGPRRGSAWPFPWEE